MNCVLSNLTGYYLPRNSQPASAQCEMVPPAVHRNPLVHSIVYQPLDWAVINFPSVLVNILKPHPGTDQVKHVDERSTRFSNQSSRFYDRSSQMWYKSSPFSPLWTIGSNVIKIESILPLIKSNVIQIESILLTIELI